MGNSETKRRARVGFYGVTGFALASLFAIVQRWSLPEFCWSTWLAGLLYTWASVLVATIQVILHSRSARSMYEGYLPFIVRLPGTVFVLCVAVVACGVGWLAFRVYSFLFAFYGIFLSVFAAMEPESLFGANGFINSDFFTPVMHLIERFWPMALGVFIANWRVFARLQSWKRMVLPLEREIVRLHIMVLAVPFLSLIAWFIVGDRYQIVVVVVLMGILYLIPGRQLENETQDAGNSDQGGDHSVSNVSDDE